MSEREPVTMMAATTRLDYVFTAGVAMSKNLHGYEQGKFIGQRCPKCKKVYIPSRGSCPTDGLPTDEIVELPNTGTVTTYCVVNVPFAGQSIEIPYICGQILLDGANLSFMGLIQEIPTDEIRMGMRVEAVWVAARGAGADVGLGQVLPSHRRARRRLRDLQGVPVSEFPGLVSGRRPVGVVSFAQYDNVRREDARNEVEMLMPVVAEVFGNIGITKDDVGFICSGSTDYLIGGPFSFVAALDAVGVWPPRAESHVEMDGAWALYEAWVLLQEGEIDAALVYAFGRSSMGDLSEILSVQLDPYYLAPLWPDPTSLAALQAQAMIDKGTASEADFAAVASRSRRSALGEPQGAGGLRPLARGAAGRGLRGGAAAPARAAAADRRLRRRRPGGGRPGLRAVRAAGLHHRHRPPHRDALGGRPRPHACRPRRSWPGRRPGSGPKKVDVAELHAPYAHQELILAEALGLGDGVAVNPSGGALAANPMMSAGLIRIGESAQAIWSGQADRAVAHATSGPVPAAEPGLRPGGCVMAERCAVIGVGQTVAKSKREDVSIAGLVREAALAALEDAGLDVRRHRRRGRRQGARHVRGRHDARALPRAGARRGGQADVPRPHGRLGRRVDGHRGVAPRGVGDPRARPHRGLREAERLGRHVGPLGAPALLGAAAGRRRRVLRPHHPGLHVPLRRADATSA